MLMLVTVTNCGTSPPVYVWFLPFQHSDMEVTCSGYEQCRGLASASGFERSAENWPECAFLVETVLDFADAVAIASIKFSKHCEC